MESALGRPPVGEAEAVEGAYLRAFAEAAPVALRSRLGLTVARAADATVLALSDEAHSLLNRAAGFGEPVTPDLLDRVIDILSRAGAPHATVKVASSLLPDGWVDLVGARGMTPGTGTVKLARAAGEVPRTRTDLRVGPVGDEDEQGWLRLAMSVFDAPPPHLAEMFRGVGRNPSSHRFAAWDGDEVVACGLLFVHGRTGVLKSGATLASHRSRGAQSALIAARLAAARRAGCRWVVSETTAPGPGERVTSLENLLRAGFVRAFDYRNLGWRWGAPAIRAAGSPSDQSSRIRSSPW